MTGSPEAQDGTIPVGADVVQPPFGIKPPLIALALIAVGLVVHILFPVQVLVSGWVQFTVGLPVVALGIFAIGASARTFQRADTDDRFESPTSVIVSEGPYSFSRNPMYVGATVAFTGVALAVNTVWILVLVPVLLAYFWFGVVLREERYLQRRFGDAYVEYKSRVRRWL